MLWFQGGVGWLETLNNMNYRLVLSGDEGVANFLSLCKGHRRKILGSTVV